MKKYVFLLVFSSLFFSHCSDEETIDTSGALKIQSSSLYQLPALANGFEYEGWLLINGFYVSVGSFTLDDLDPNLEIIFSNIDAKDLSDASGFAITLEESAGSASPSDAVILLGEFDGNAANLSSEMEINETYSTIGHQRSAQYTLQVPTFAGTNLEVSFKNGLWFFQDETPLLDLGFSLDYVYQAFLQLNDNLGATIYLNMGKIEIATNNDNSNVYTSYVENVPEFPGEDFLAIPAETTLDLNFPIDLTATNAKVLIQLVPEAYTLTTPTGFSLFEGVVPMSGQENQTYSLDLVRYEAIATKL